MTIKARVRFGVGYGSHETVLEFEDGTDPQEIKDECSDYARERFWWAHEIIADDE